LAQKAGSPAMFVDDPQKNASTIAVDRRERTLPTAQPIRGAAMTQDVLGALWFITLLISAYGMVTGDLCLWRRDD
jgi:hypothetical protein